MGSNGSRSMVTGGSALVRASDKIIEKGRKIAAHLLEAAEADIAFADNKFTVVGTDRADHAEGSREGRVPTGAAAEGHGAGPLRECDLPADARHLSQFLPCRARSRSIPTRARSSLVTYLVVDDVGTVINPLTLKGQIHGGVAQGAGADPDRAGGL